MLFSPLPHSWRALRTAPVTLNSFWKRYIYRTLLLCLVWLWGWHRKSPTATPLPPRFASGWQAKMRWGLFLGIITRSRFSDCSTRVKAFCAILFLESFVFISFCQGKVKQCLKAGVLFLRRIIFSHNFPSQICATSGFSRFNLNLNLKIDVQKHNTFFSGHRDNFYC